MKFTIVPTAEPTDAACGDGRPVVSAPDIAVKLLLHEAQIFSRPVFAGQFQIQDNGKANGGSLDPNRRSFTRISFTSMTHLSVRRPLTTATHVVQTENLHFGSSDLTQHAFGRRDQRSDDGRVIDGQRRRCDGRPINQRGRHQRGKTGLHTSIERCRWPVFRVQVPGRGQRGHGLRPSESGSCSKGFVHQDHPVTVGF